MLFSRVSIFVSFFLVLFSLQANFVQANTYSIKRHEIAKGDIDQRTYHYQVLPNQLKVLLISDPKADKAAASLDVNVGAYDDPKDRQGLAHFLEHMLFLGTEKYPEADEYQSFISSYGGSHNAYTSARHTNYFFDIDSSELAPALDRFAHFFIDPLFDAHYVDRERNAVHSEYQAKIRDDYRRSNDVFRTLVNPHHPASHFSVGSLETLVDREGDLVRDDLLDFYQQHYSSEKMALVVLGKEPIEELQALVVPLFSQVPQKNSDAVERPVTPPSVFQENFLPVEVFIEPVKDIRQMSLRFSLPETLIYYREKPLDYIAYLLGHEGEGSLLSLLKAEGLAENLSAGAGDDGAGRSAFYITIELTPKGFESRELIRSLVFETLDMIRSEGVSLWRYQEKQQLAELAFRFREAGDPMGTVRHLASNLQEYTPEDVIRGDYLLQYFDPALIKFYLDKMTPDSVYVTTTALGVETDKTTQYYQTPYRVQSISTDPIDAPQNLLAGLALPKKNPFIPEKTELFGADSALTTVSSIEIGDTQVWAKQDTSFGVPKASVYFRYLSPRVSGDLKGSVMNSLYVALLKDQLNEHTYPALLAGISFDLNAHTRGIDILLSGYQDKLPYLMGLLKQAIEAGEVDPVRFEQLKTDMLRDLRNSDKKIPYHQMYQLLATSIYPLLWPDSDKLVALESVTLEDLKAFANQWREGASVESLFYGNISKQWLNDWQPDLVEVLPFDRALSPALVAKLDFDSTHYVYQDVNHADKAAALYVQGPADDRETQAIMMVIKQMLQSPYYNSLRTEQQLGYIVFVGSLRLREVPGIVFMVQSPTASIDQIQGATDSFLNAFAEQMPSEFSQYQQAVITQLLEAPQNLQAKADIYWDDILSDNVEFNERQVLAETVEKLSADQIQAVYREVMLTPKTQLWAISNPPVDVSAQTELKSVENFYSYP